MKAGALRDRVTVQKRGTPGTKYRPDGQSWSAVVSARPARIAPMTGVRVNREEVIADRLAGVSIYEITMRDETALSGITTAWRIVDDRTSAVYDIRHIMRPDRLRRDLVLMCETGATDDAG